MKYHFFDARYEGFSSDLFSVPHIVFIVLVFLLVPTISVLLRKKASAEKIDKFLKIYSIVMPVLEAAKITYSTLHDFAAGQPFNVEGILPLYTCSLFMYTLIVAAWTKGKTKEYSLSFITTVSLVSGAIGVVYCNGLNFHPFWTFGAFYSLFFHSSMFAVGTFLLVSGYKKLDWIDVFKAWVPLLMLALVSTPVNYEYGADYMQTYSGSGVPFYNGLAATLAEHRLRFVYTIIMLLTYIPMAAVVVSVYKLISKTVNGKAKGDAAALNIAS